MDVLVLHEKVTRRQVICAVLCIGVAHLIRSRKQAEESEQE